MHGRTKVMPLFLHQNTKLTAVPHRVYMLDSLKEIVSVHVQLISLGMLQVIRVLHNKTLAKAAHDIKRLKLLSDISQFDSQILKLTTYVFLWIHWNACLQYGSCVAQPDSR